MEYNFSIYSIPRGIKRIDAYISDGLGICTRNQLKQRISGISINNVSAKLSRKPAIKDHVTFVLNDVEPLSILPEDIPLDIIFENDEVMLINKPQGMVVHPGAGNYSGTLAHALLHHVDELVSDDDRPGIVHRLDKETSGIIITAKNPDTLEFLSGQFRDKKVQKQYLAILYGIPKEKQGRIENLLGRSRRDRKKFAVVNSGGKPAVTQYKVLAEYDGFAFVKLMLETGRTHQLRVHMQSLGCPIAGDPVYGGRHDTTGSLMLHAYTLSITLPSEQTPIKFRAPLPPRFKQMLKILGRQRKNN